MTSVLFSLVVVYTIIIFPATCLLMAIRKTIRLWRGTYSTGLQRPAIDEGDIAAYRRQYESELASIKSAGLEPDEFQAAKDMLRQRYLRQVEGTIAKDSSQSNLPY